MTVLVTGGCGFIGSAMVRRLKSQGEHVLVLDSGWRTGRHVNQDIRNFDDVHDAVQRCNEVIHMASINGTRHFYEKPELVLDVGLRGICNVINACISHRVRKLMVMSSSEVYQTPPIIPTPETVPYSIPDPFNPRYSYAVQKIATEMVAIHNAHHFDKLIIVRPHNIYGPDAGEEHVIPRLARDVNNFYDGNQTRAFCYIDDAIDGLTLLRERGQHNHIYNLGTDEEIKLVAVARMVARLTGQPLELIVSMKTKDGGTERRCPDISKIRALGYEPKVSLQEGLKKTLAWYAHEKAPA